MPPKIRDIYPHLSELDGYSIEVAGWIHRVYPQWTGYMRVDRYKRTVELHGPSAEFSKEELFLGIHIPAPVPSPSVASLRDLVIYTQREELTICFDNFHTHFGIFHTKAKEAFLEAKVFIDRLLHEEIIVLIGVKGFGACCAPEFIDEAIQECLDKGYTVDYTRSWRGTYNRVYDSDRK